jgi:hypothetical protein
MVTARQMEAARRGLAPARFEIRQRGFGLVGALAGRDEFGGGKPFAVGGGVTDVDQVIDGLAQNLMLAGRAHGMQYIVQGTKAANTDHDVVVEAFFSGDMLEALGHFFDDVPAQADPGSLASRGIERGADVLPARV